MEHPPAYHSHTKSSPPTYPLPEDNHDEEPYEVSTQPLPFPQNEDSPIVVRAYIQDFLARNAAAHGLTRSDISRLTQGWRFGTGRELREYDLATWKELMGTEMGTIMSHHIAKARPQPPMDTAVRGESAYTASIDMAGGTDTCKVILFVPFIFISFLVAMFNTFAIDEDDRIPVAWPWVVLSLILFLFVVSLFGKRLMVGAVAGRRKIREIRAGRSQQRYEELSLGDA